MIGEDKTRVLITIPKDMKAELETIADKEMRKLSNFIVLILADYLKNHSDETK